MKVATSNMVVNEGTHSGQSGDLGIWIRTVQEEVLVFHSICVWSTRF